MTLTTTSIPESRYATALRTLNKQYPDPVYGDGRVFVIGAGTYSVSEALTLLDGLGLDPTQARSTLIRQTRQRRARAMNVPVFAATLAIMCGEPDAGDDHIMASLSLRATRPFRKVARIEGRAALPQGVLDQDDALDALDKLDGAWQPGRARAGDLKASYAYYVEADDPDAQVRFPHASWEEYLVDYVDARRASGFLTAPQARGGASQARGAGAGDPQDAVLEAGLRYLCGELTFSQAKSLAPAVADVPEVRDVILEHSGNWI